MPDITMCDDCSCPHRTICYRFCAKPSERQSWFLGSPRDGQDCSEFLELRRKKPEPEEISLFQSGVILALCIIGMVLMVIVCAIF